MLRYWKWQDMFAALVLIAGGITILVKPELTLNTMAKAVGILLMLVGLIFILAYFARRKRHIIGYDLVLGIFALGLGIFVFIAPKFVSSLLPIIFSICIILSGVLKLQRGLDLKKLKIMNWGYTVIMGLGSILLGTIIFLNPIKVQIWLLRLIALSFIYSGITDLVTAIYVSWKYSHFIVNSKAGEPEITLEETANAGKGIDGYYDSPDDGGPDLSGEVQVQYDKDDEVHMGVLDRQK